MVSSWTQTHELADSQGFFPARTARNSYSSLPYIKSIKNMPMNLQEKHIFNFFKKKLLKNCTLTFFGYKKWEKPKLPSNKFYNSTRQLAARLDSQLAVPNSARLDSHLVNSNSTRLAKFLSETIPN